MRKLVSPLIIATLMTGAAWAEGYPIGGLTPSVRPDGAPVITIMTKAADWYAKALTGVEPPYPTSLCFLEDQGGWYSPFLRPGMIGLYDIRHWHSGE